MNASPPPTTDATRPAPHRSDAIARAPVIPYAVAPRAPRILLALCALGLLLRLVAIFVTHAWTSPNAMEHRSLALSMMQGNGFSFGDFGYYGPSSVQSPTYPLILYALFNVFGPDAPAAYLAAMVLNALAGGATVWLTFKLARAMGASPAVGLVAAALVAVWPTQVYAVTVAQAISLITLATVACVVFFYDAVRTARLAPWIAFSIVGILAALTEPVLLPVMAMSGVVVLLWRTLPMGVRLRNGTVLLLATILIIGPWAVRNRQVHGKWVPIKSTFWVNVWKANNPYATGTDRLPLPADKRASLWRGLFTNRERDLRDPTTDKARQYDKLAPADLARLEKQPDAVREDVFKDIASTWISQNKPAYVRLCLVRLGKTLWIDWDNPKSYSIFNVAPRAALLVLTAFGLALAARRRWSLFYPGLLVGLCLLTYTLTITAARFMFPIEPILLCLTALAVAWVVRRRWTYDNDADARADVGAA